MHKHVNFFIIINKVFAKVKTINATGDLVYTATLEGIQPMKSFKFYIDTKSNQGSIALKAISIPGKPPTAVSNITVNNNGSHFVVNWDEPVKTNGPISSYTAYLLLHGEKGTIVARESNSTTSTHYAFLVREYLGDGKATISFNVTATNMFGTSPSDGITYECSQTVNIPNDTNIIVAGVVAAVFLVGTILVIVIIIVIAKRHVRTAAQQGFREFPKTFNGVPKDIMEINEDSYKLYFKRLPPAMVDRWVIPLHMFNTSSFHLLGEGNFSSVYFSLVRGPLSTPTQLDQFRNYSEESIAVKLLKGGASEKEMEAFLNEAEILKTLSTQSCPYVVQLVGLQLEHAPPMIAMELVPCGNLLNILRSSCLADDDEEPESLLAFALPKHPRNLARRQTLVEFQRDRAKSIDSYCQLRSYSLQSDSLNLPVEAKISVKASQLLKFAIQAIRGMEHLQLFGILHRDLACRNLLLSANGIIKISDFGFACFLDGKSEVVAELPTDSKPLRWMSPEAFENDVYSEASDVWSFGVALWELFNQGKFPYPTLSDSDVMVAVKTGNYVECPENCDEKVYNLMLNCWMLNPNDRPTFSALKNTLEGFMYDLYPYMMVEVQEVPNE
jgi:serine/threonine protein kinase